jgi:hypothetical protein
MANTEVGTVIRPPITPASHDGRFDRMMRKGSSRLSALSAGAGPGAVCCGGPQQQQETGTQQQDQQRQSTPVIG